MKTTALERALDATSQKITGVDAFIADVSRRVAAAPPSRQGTARFIQGIAEAYAFIRLQDVYSPRRFLMQMAGVPPVQFGNKGFRRSLVDDQNPARHYTAFVFVGFWLPVLPATLVLWTWEILSFFRYGGHWSAPDMRMGRIGIQHGRWVRRYSPAILPGLIAQDLTERN
jgi:hypothetical protein